MRGHDAHAKAVGTALCGRDCSLVNVITVSVCAACLIEESPGRIANVAVIHFAVVGFHSYMFWIDCAEMNPSADFQRFADGNILPIFITDLDLINFHLRPILADACFPLAQVARRRAIVL